MRDRCRGCAPGVIFVAAAATATIAIPSFPVPLPVDECAPVALGVARDLAGGSSSISASAHKLPPVVDAHTAPVKVTPEALGAAGDTLGTTSCASVAAFSFCFFFFLLLLLLLLLLTPPRSAGFESGW